MGRAVRYLAGEAGIRQFLDIGTGLPTADSTHEIAQQVAPKSRIVYVDYAPVVLLHAHALRGTPQGATDYLDFVDRSVRKLIEVDDRSAPYKPIRQCLLLARCKLAPSQRCGAIR
jgi:hypothetical protein